jgi:hypothetical protein
MAVGISTARGGAEARHEQKKKKERRSSFSGALLLKSHKAVDDDGRNGGREMAAAKPWARARQRPSQSEGDRCGLGAVQVVRLTLGAHTVFVFS